MVASAFFIGKGPANLRLFERFLAEAVKKVWTLRDIAVNNSHNYLFIVNPPLGGLFNLAKSMELVPYKELDYKVEKLKYNKLGVMRPRIKNKSDLPVGE